VAMTRLGFGWALVVATVAALLTASSASAMQGQPGSDGAPATPAAVFSPDQMIVEWAAGASPVERRAVREEADVDFERDLGNRRFQLVEVEPGQTPREAIRELEADPTVVLAERDAYAAELAIPDDPLFGQLWGLQNTGLGIYDFLGALPGVDINASSAWDRTVGTPTTVVADIDGGYRFEHPDLANVAWTNPGETLDGADNDDNGIVDDVHGADFVGTFLESPVVDGDPTDDDMATIPSGHGVHTAGTIAAEGDNGIGITGVAQDVSIMPLRVCSITIFGRGCSYSAMVEAVNYAGAKGARVANISIGSDVGSTAFADALAANPQTLFVIAAGNEGESNEVKPHYPCVYNPLAEGKSTVDNVICVAATDQADQRADFSNWGVNTVDLGAPGTEILSTAPYRYFIEDDFEVDNFASKWTASGEDGGFVRTDEAPFNSFGISDSPGAIPGARMERASTSDPITVPAGYQSCALELTSSSPKGGGFLEVLLDGENELGVGFGSGHISHKLLGELSGGGEVSVRVSYTAGPNPSSSSGVWIDDISLHCIAKIGEADGYRFAEGTSMAAPHVTGAAALLFSLKPSASASEVRQGLLRSVDPVSSLAGKTTSGGRLDAAAALDLFDTVPPPTPTLSATNPASPSKNNQPRLIGSTQRGTTIAVYASTDCSGPPVASGTAAQLAGVGIAVDVADNTTTQFAVRATDLAPLTSVCSAPIAYIENTDLVAPTAPQLVSTDPASPASNGTPRILGAAEAGATVRVYAGLSCAGLPVATGSAAQLGSPGIPVQVAEGVTGVFSARATDASDNTSACSAPISYTHVKATTNQGGGGDGPTTNQGNGNGGPGPDPGSACIVPKLAGKTLARAKAALSAASCKLGTVRTPRSRKGGHLPPLVVKSSTPAAGARPSSGKVNLTLGPKPRKAHR
jgi:subtilisin family serine protease